MKRTLGLVAITMTAMAGLTSCSSSGEEAPEPKADASVSAPSSGADAVGVKEACERFNELYADLGAVTPGDSDAYDDIYLSADEAAASAPGDTAGLFAALSKLALERGLGEEPSADTQAAILDAVTANSGACTAEGVTLTI